MYYLEKIKKHISAKVNRHFEMDILDISDISFPPNPDFGDLALPCFKLAKELKKSPQEAAEDLLNLFSTDKIISGVSLAGPYLNLNLNKEATAKNVLTEIYKLQKGYGMNRSGKNKRVMIEYSNANTHKEVHIGHLRNISFGDGIAKILNANGYYVIPVSYVNDFGINVAKTLWCYEVFYKYSRLPKNKGRFLGEIYQRSTEEIEKDPKAKLLVSLIMKKIETKKGSEYDLWKTTRLWSIEQFDKIYQELGIKFKATFYESEFIEQGKKLVGELYEKHFLIKSDKAIIANLEEYGLGVLVFMRSDGTALYPVADIPLAFEKFSKFKLDSSIYIVDQRQSLYFKQLFKVMDLLGHKKKMVHLSYDFVKLPSGMMSSRTGNVVAYEDLKEQMLEKALRETKSRHADWPLEKIIEIAQKITIGAMKFEMLKVNADSIIIFDIDQALRFDGFTSAYLQYTGARINSIIKNTGDASQLTPGGFKYLTEKLEKILILKLAQYPETVLKAAENYDTSLIARYLFELAQRFNEYYHEIPILKADINIKLARLFLISSISQTVKNGLHLLGIEPIDEM